jgi:membrane associated rhomboid family serine protease
VILAVPLYDDNPVTRAPVVTYALIGLCVAVFLWELGQDEETVSYSYGMIPAVLFGGAKLARGLAAVPPWATIFTSMFLHSGWLHIGGNMLFLWIFGNNIEDVLGHARYGLLYLVSGVVAVLAQAAADPGSTVPMIGASGAIAGVLGAYLLLYPRSNVHVFVWIVIFFRIVTVPAWIMLGLWFGMQLVSGLTSGAGSPGVAFWAHVGGFLCGLALIVPLRPRGMPLWQMARGPRFAAAPPVAFEGRRTFHSGSVPDAGQRYRPPPRGPWG